MRILDFVTAVVFYFPFLFSIAFGIFLFLLGIATFFTGTIVFFILSFYGFYAVLRDFGILERVIQLCKKNWTFWSRNITGNLQKSFTIHQLENLPSTPALFICHPHGLVGYSWWMHFCYGLHPWPKDKPKPLFAMHSILFRIPFVRDMLDQVGCIEADEKIIRGHLQKGKSVALLTGGVEEMHSNGETPIKLVLQKRKGYARIAKECGVAIVPMFTIGENELFPNETFGPWNTFRLFLYKTLGIPLLLPTWSSMKDWNKILQGPLETPVQTFVLNPVSTQDKPETEIRKECVQTMKTFLQEQNLNAQIIA
jgi:1-acyl-sn-glycerol-3-phosphate acyltransferase